MSLLNHAVRTQWSIFIVAIVSLLCAFAALPAIADPADEIRCLKDLAYKADGETQYERDRCKLDLYLPAKGEGFATIVWFHGGSIQAGDKAGNIAVAFGRRFADEGIAVASVNYRLHPQASIRRQFIRRNCFPGRNRHSMQNRSCTRQSSPECG
jgi:acetyl esterase/lipase